MWLIAVTAIVFITSGDSSPITDPIVSTNVGLIRGRHATDGNYAMYLGIPYAQIDKNNPFGDHIAQPPFSNFEVFDAADDSTLCPQQDQFTNVLMGNLDCLQLNVYVPDSASPQNKLPVMVWIHGGQFAVGAKWKKQFGPKYIIKHDVIVVNINYRVGSYGFMCLDIPEVPGNQGLKDQQAALKWIKNNIAAFGGDNNNIVVAGESAGSASVDLQLRYNTDDTFHKVILESGSASGSWAIKPPDYQMAIKLANQLGFRTVNSNDSVKYLAAADPHDVITASRELRIEVWPCPEKEFNGVKRFINDYAMNVDIPKAKNTPILMGVNSDEWLGRYINKDDDFFETLEVFKTNLIEAFDFTDSEVNEMEEIIERFYLGGDGISKEKYRQLGQFDTDFTFIHPAKRSLVEYIDNGATNIYNYLFSYNGKRNYGQVRYNATEVGAFHGDELGYLFDVFYLDEPNEEDQLMIERMTTMWTNFIKYGDPTPEGATDLLPVKWPKVTAETSAYLSIGSTIETSPLMLNDRMLFWDLIYLINETKRVGYRPKKSVYFYKNALPLIDILENKNNKHYKSSSAFLIA